MEIDSSAINAIFIGHKYSQIVFDFGLLYVSYDLVFEVLI